MLQVNNGLSWRDVQYILRQTATFNDPTSSSWLRNAVGVWFSYLRGFGRVNAGAAVGLSAVWPANSTGTLQTFATPCIYLSPSVFATGNAGASATVYVNVSLSVTAIEHVLVHISLINANSNSGRVTVQLTSPQATSINLIIPTPTTTQTTLTSYPLAARGFWGENATGVWSLTVINADANIVTELWAYDFTVTGQGVASVTAAGCPPPLPTVSSSSNSLPTEAIVGIAIGAAVVVVGFILLAKWRGWLCFTPRHVSGIILQPDVSSGPR